MIQSALVVVQTALGCWAAGGDTDLDMPGFPRSRFDDLIWDTSGDTCAIYRPCVDRVMF